MIAHRGASWVLQENTLPAFERAIELRADYVELDVRAARDGSLVVCHEPPRRGEPRLEEAIELLRGRVGVMCELKSPWRYRRHDVVGRTVRLLPEDAAAVSFDPRALEAVTGRRLLQHVGSVRRSDPRPATYGASASAIRGSHGGGSRKRVHSGSASARPHTREPSRADAGAGALGVDGIFSDRPDLLRATLLPPQD